MKYDVVDVQPVIPIELQVRFAEGAAVTARFEASHLTCVFEALRDPIVFAQARIGEEVVTSLGNLDLAPDATCAKIKSHRNCICAVITKKNHPEVQCATP